MSEPSIDNVSICIESGGSSSSRSRDAVIKGAKAFAWCSEKVRSDQPYAHGLFHRPHNPPPNELGFVGGIGRNLGRRRSKVHPQRPTQLQQIFGMRNQNKILHSFTQPTRELVASQPKRRSNAAARSMHAIVRDVTSADMIASSISQLATGSTVSSPHDPKRAAPQPPTSPDPNDLCDPDQIDGLPFYYSPATINERVRNYVLDSQKDDEHADVRRMPVSEEQTFRRWAMRLRQDSDRQHSDGESSASSGSKRRAAPPDSYRTDGASSGANAPEKASGKPARSQGIFKKLTGYMYGPFTRPPTPDPLTRDANKFGIPRTMSERAARREQRGAIEAEVLRRQRMEKMGMRQPPASDESEDGDEDGASDGMQNVKHLALVRTPYFVVPTIRMDRVKRVTRYCNQYLRGDRLKRVNLLLRDEARPKTQTKEQQEELVERRTKTVLAKFTSLRSRRKQSQKDTSGRDPEKAGYHEIIDSGYARNRAMVEPDEENARPISFGQFKNIPDPMELQNLAMQLDPLDWRSEVADTDRAHSLRSRFAKSQPKKLFERSRNERLSRHADNIDGPFYIDPNLMDKFRSPKKFKSPQKYYTNLIKGKHWIRDRLQVNGPSFEEEKIGVKDKKYFHRLATEWDEYYFHDLRNRPRVRKFCVKTDIQVIRNICRQNFVMYNIQENLIDMKTKQQKESEYMDNVEKFQKICLREFDVWKNEAYDKVVKSNQRLDVLRRNHDQLEAEKEQLIIDIDCSNLRLFELEQRWNFLMKLQNYYYLFQNCHWREKHDWIHRGPDGSLNSPMTTFRECSVLNIRPSSESSGLLIKAFFDTNIEPKLEKMLEITPDANEFRESLELLNENAKTRLKQHKFSFWTFKGILSMSKQLTQKINENTETKSELITRLRAKSELMIERSRQAKEDALALIDHGLPKAITGSIERKILAIANEMHKDLQKTAQLDSSQSAASTPLQRFEQINRYAMQLLNRLDELPVDVLREAETTVRENRRIVEERVADALSKHKRYELMRRQIENHFSKVAQFRRVTIVTDRKNRTIDGSD